MDMLCPFCDHKYRTNVVNSRPSARKTLVWRRRRCLNCKETFTTYEKLDLSYLHVAKRSGSSEPYSRAKLFTSLYKAHLDANEAEALTDTVEHELIRLRRVLFSSTEISELAAKILEAFDKRSHARYASFQPKG